MRFLSLCRKTCIKPRVAVVTVSVAFNEGVVKTRHNELYGMLGQIVRNFDCHLTVNGNDFVVLGKAEENGHIQLMQSLHIKGVALFIIKISPIPVFSTLRASRYLLFKSKSGA